MSASEPSTPPRSWFWMYRVLPIIAASMLATPATKTRAEDLPRPIALRPSDAQHLDHATHHVQGLDIDADHYWISSVDRATKKGFVFRFARATGKVAAERELAFGNQFHPGGICLSQGALWLPVAEYRPRSSTTVAKLHPLTLDTQATFKFDDHLGCLAVNEQGEILAANWDARIIYRLNAEGKKLAELSNPRPAAYQDLKFVGGVLVGGGTERSNGATISIVDRLEPATLKLLSRWLPQGELRSGGKNFGREGCAIRGGELFLMPEDGPHTTIYRFAIPAEPPTR